jgi:hypothetical protein
MKRNKKSVSVKNTKSFLGNAPALVNTTFFVPAANLNSNDGIFTDLHDYPSNFSSSNQDPNWQFDISNKIFAQSNKKKIFSDDKFKNMIDYNQDRYTGDMFSGDFAPVENYSDVVRAVSPVLAEINYPTYQSDVDLQPVSRLYDDTFMNAEVIRQAEQSGSDFFVSRQNDSNLVSSTTDADLIKLIGQEKFDSEVASKYRDGMLISPPPTPEMEMGDVAVQNAADPKPDTKAKKPFNWLPIILVAAAVGGYMYYNRKK